jgi:hypothetical protein
MNIHAWRDSAEGTHVAAVIDEGEGLRYRDICLGMETLLAKNTKLLSTANQFVDCLEVLTVVLQILEDAEIILLSTYSSKFLAPNQYLCYQRRSEHEDINLSSSDSLIKNAGHLPKNINIIRSMRSGYLKLKTHTQNM